MSKTYSRRDFLKGTAAGALGMAMAGVNGGILVSASEATYTPGTYTASAQGIFSEVTVTMTFDETSILEVVIDASGETESIGGAAVDELQAAILEAQSAEIDGVSGATITSNAVKEAAASCIDQAKGLVAAESTEGTTEEATDAAESTSSWRDAPDPIDDSEIVQTYDVEIGIVGMGHAGLSVCRAAAEAGATVFIAESQSEDGWTTFGHDIGHINSQFLKDRGVPEVDPVEFYNNLMIQTGCKANPKFLMDFAKNSGSAVDWFLEPVSDEILEYAHVTFWPDNEYTVKELSNGLRYYTGTAQWWETNWIAGADTMGDGVELKELSQANLDYVRENYPDVTVSFSTKGKQLVQDDDGKVTGFIAEGPEGYIKVNASKGVVLAGGGLGGNQEMCHDLISHITQMFTPDEDYAFSFDRDGSTIKMGYWAGGRLEGEISTMNVDTISGPDTFSGLWLDTDGNRFQNEAFAGPELNGMYLARARRGQIVAIYDSTYETQMLTGHPAHGAFDYSNSLRVDEMEANFQAARDAGAEGADGYYCADTLEELAEMVGYSGDAKEQFLESIEHYNELCETGEDTDFGKDPHFLFPVTEAPFYAHASTSSIGFALVTTGAFVTTNDFQVVDENYQPIEGLYASGNTCGLRFGAAYVTPIPGMSIGMCLTQGRALGESLAAKTE